MVKLIVLKELDKLAKTHKDLEFFFANKYMYIYVQSINKKYYIMNSWYLNKVVNIIILIQGNWLNCSMYFLGLLHFDYFNGYFYLLYKLHVF